MEPPINSVSVLIANYNTKPIYIKECIDSIINQNGIFAIELVWINDGTDKDLTRLLEQELQRFQMTKKNAKVIYKKHPTNMGLSCCLHDGVFLCTNEIIFRMDSDDIMAPERLNIQYNFIHKTPDCVLCGCDMIAFTSDHNSQNKKKFSETNHKHKLTWEEYKLRKSEWILNHPTLCFRKSAILEVGNYDKDLKLPFEDLDLELRVLKRFECVYNLSEMLLMYRMHEQQITQIHKDNTKINQKKKQYIDFITSTTR